MTITCQMSRKEFMKKLEVFNNPEGADYPLLRENWIEPANSMLRCFQNGVRTESWIYPRFNRKQDYLL
ncbi:hypothetical protein DGWBC_1529 [Dehalogenimonas sp. WBC-2]|nr:hypothetical protein DGWBC_1529 [Dehalogenimonas sp. WBC-2]